jgi:nucleoside-diphosphate-sugar epimerase
VMSMRRARGLSASIVRLFNTYGPRMRRNDGRVIPELVTAALEGRPLTVHGDGSQTRSFMYVDDLVEGLIHVGLDRSSDGEVFNIGNPHEITVRQLAQRIAEIIEGDLHIVEIPSRPGDPQRRKPDIQKMTATFGWEPLVPLDIGLRRTIAAVQRTGVRAIPVHAQTSQSTDPGAIPSIWTIPATSEHSS